MNSVSRKNNEKHDTCLFNRVKSTRHISYPFIFQTDKWPNKQHGPLGDIYRRERNPTPHQHHRRPTFL